MFPRRFLHFLPFCHWIWGKIKHLKKPSVAMSTFHVNTLSAFLGFRYVNWLCILKRKKTNQKKNVHSTTTLILICLPDQFQSMAVFSCSNFYQYRFFMLEQVKCRDKRIERLFLLSYFSHWKFSKSNQIHIQKRVNMLFDEETSLLRGWKGSGMIRRLTFWF